MTTISDRLPASRRQQEWTDHERRWGRQLFEAMLPDSKRRPGFASLDTDEFWTNVRQRSPRDLKLGLRAAVWLLTLWPIFTAFSWRPFHHLRPEQRDAFPRAASSSRLYVVREGVELVKMLACFAYFGDSSLRREFEEHAV